MFNGRIPFNKIERWHLFVFIFSLLILTHQILWNPLHGDGAFYALILRDMNFDLTSPLFRASGHPYFDHPYFFFYFGYPFIKIFGYSDWAIKLPNIFVGFFTLILILLISKKTNQNHVSGFFALIVLMLSPGYEHQLRMPSLDPLAHFLAISSLYLLLRSNLERGRDFLIAGLILGFSFLTKGLEILPHLGAMLLIILFVNNVSLYQKIRLDRFFLILKFLFGLFIIVLIWYIIDTAYQIGWFQGYYQYQFSNRFFKNQNFETSLFSLIFLKKLIVITQPWLLIALYFNIRFYIKNKFLPLLWKYLWIYLVLLTIAFSLIKKDSIQHFTGLFILIAIVVGQGLYYEWSSFSEKKQIILKKLGQYFLFFLVVSALGLSTYFWIKPYDKKDLWSAVKNQKAPLDLKSTKILLLNPESPWQEQMYWTGRWYWSNPIIWVGIDQRPSVQIGQTIILATANAEGTSIELKEITVENELFNQINKK